MKKSKHNNLPKNIDSPNYNTKLSSSEEKEFKDWYSKVSKYKGLSEDPDDPSQEYDYRGYWKNEDRNGILGDDPNAHFIDKYKKPGHPTFSNESQYSNEETPGGSWSQDEQGTWYFNHSPHTAKSIAKTQQYLRGTGEFSVNPNTGEVLTDVHRDIIPQVGPLFESAPVMSDSELKSKMALQSALGNKSAQRMTQLYPNTYEFTGQEKDAFFNSPIGVPQGETGTHFMASMGNYAVPFIQQGQEGLYFNENANPSNPEAIQFETPEQALYFSENYKRVAPMMRNTKKYGGTSMRKVRITGLPIAAMGGAPYNQTAPNYIKNDLGQKHLKMKKLLEGVPRDQANIEAERGETVVFPDQGGLPAHYKIGGNRHHSGGTPLSVPQDAFVFSDTSAMKIKDADTLAEFGMPAKKGGYTPADIAKKYDINKYREILQDDTQDKLAKDTAEKMIMSFNLKLGKLALLQEAMKGFPTGIPLIALPYMEANGIEPEDVLPGLKEEPGASEETEMLEEDSNEMMDENPEMERFGGIPTKGNLDLLGKLRKVRINMPTDPNNGLYIMEPGGGVPPSTQNKQPQTVKKAKVPSDAVIVKRKDYKTEEEYKTARDKAFAEAKDKTKVFIDLGDGNFKRVQSKAFQFPEYKGQDLDKAFKGDKERAGRYQYIEDQINGNPQLKQKLYDETIKMLEDTKKKNPKSLKTRGVDIDKMIAELTPDKVAENFLQMQKRNLALGTHMGNEKVKGSKNAPSSSSSVSNKELTDAAANAGIPMPDAMNAALQQASYVAFDNLAERNEAPGFTPGQFGAADEKTGKKPTISPVDAIYTNTTAGQITGIAGQDSIEEIDPEFEDITQEQPQIEEDPYKTKDPKFGYYTQDDANLALAGRNYLNIRKATPWAAAVNLKQPDLVYHDPTGAQQRSLGAYNTAVRAAGAFGTGQGTARLSDFMAKAMENSAMIEAQTQQADVAVTNQFEAQKDDIWNKSMFANADLATALYDKAMAGDQAYRNSKTAALNQVVQMRNNRLTNAVNTYNINTMNPNFQVDPTQGGTVNFYQGSKMEPGSSPTFSDTFASLRQDPNLSMLSSEDLAEIAKEQMGMNSSSAKAKKTQADSNQQYMEMYNRLYPGQVGPPQQAS